MIKILNTTLLFLFCIGSALAFNPMTDIEKTPAVELEIYENEKTVNLISNDHAAVTAICQDITVFLDATGNATITPEEISAGNEPGAFLTLDIINFNCFNLGSNLVTLTEVDANGNTSTCTAQVTIEDNIAPVAVCQDITAGLDAIGNATITAAEIDNGSTDACGIATMELDVTSFTSADLGVNTVTLTETDVNNNVSICIATVTIIDVNPPVALCNDIAVTLDQNGSVIITPQDIDGGSTDNGVIQEM